MEEDIIIIRLTDETCTVKWADEDKEHTYNIKMEEMKLKVHIVNGIYKAISDNCRM